MTHEPPVIAYGTSNAVWTDRRGVWLARAAAAFAAVALLATAAAFVCSPYFDGRDNRELQPVSVLIPELATVGWMFACVTVVALWIALLVVRQWSKAGLTVVLLIGAALSMWLADRCLPQTYEDGFGQWIALHVDAPTSAAIRQWNASLPPPKVTALEILHYADPPAASETPVAQWPAAIRRLAPHRVTRLPGGVVLEWGQFGTWGSSRRAFIADQPTSPFNDGSGLFIYKAVHADLWFAVQGGG